MAEIRINATGGLKLYDADDSHYAQIIAGTITSNVDLLTLNSAGITVLDGAIDFDIASHDTSNGLKLGGTLVTATAAELNIMDGVTATAAEINLIDGGTSRGTDAVATGDGILINDGGTMKMTNVDTVSTYFASHSVGGTNIVTTGALNAGSITSGFGTIDVGSSAITTTGAVSGGSAVISGIVGTSGTGALKMPVGSTGQRPGSPATGMIRFSSTDTAAEIYDGSSWAAVGGGGVGGAANTTEGRVEGTIASLAAAASNTVYVAVTAGATLAGTYANRLTITGNDASVANSYIVDTMVMYDGTNTTVNLTDVGSAERLGNDTLGAGATQVTIGTPTNQSGTIFEIPVIFKNTDSATNSNLLWKIVVKSYGPTTFADTSVTSSYTT